jgi:hypothetical protein
MLYYKFDKFVIMIMSFDESSNCRIRSGYGVPLPRDVEKGFRKKQREEKVEGSMQLLGRIKFLKCLIRKVMKFGTREYLELL